LKIAITADLHLTTAAKNPERYHALGDILRQLKELHVKTLIIAGDLFDASAQNYAEFDALCQQDASRDVSIYVIPGNHDVGLTQRAIAATNVEIISTPTIKQFESRPFLFVPYTKQRTMGEAIAPLAPQLVGKEWTLVGHGDYFAGLQAPNPLEPGVYVPLTRVDVERYQPAKVFLGHVHKATNDSPVYYPGSPAPMDITETGRRRFLIVETADLSVQERPVETDIIYFQESFVVLPLHNEFEVLRRQIADRIDAWGISGVDRDKVRVRVKLAGFTTDKNALLRTVEECFRGVKFYRDTPPDLAAVAVSDDINRAEIAERAAAWIAGLDWQHEDHPPDEEAVLLQALTTIYQE